MAGLCAPLSTLRRHPRGYRRMTRGQCGSLDLHCKRLALSTPCRSSRRTDILEFIEEHQVRSVAITDGIIGCPHQEGIDYEGEWCPLCEFWHGRDRFAGQRVH